MNRLLDKVEAIRTSQRDMGITLHANSQTQSQTEDQIPVLTGSNHLSFPQWQNNAIKSLKSSGQRKEH